MHHVMLGRHDLVEDIKVRAGAVDLRATLAVPQGPVGLVVFAHANGGGRASARNRFVAEALRARGLATLMVDLLTDNEEHLDRIDSTLRFDIDMLAERLLAATAWVLDESSLAHLPLAYFGDGTAAAASLCAASRRPEAIRAVVSRAGRADLAGAALPIVRAPTLFVVGANDHARARARSRGDRQDDRAHPARDHPGRRSLLRRARHARGGRTARRRVVHRSVRARDARAAVAARCMGPPVPRSSRRGRAPRRRPAPPRLPPACVVCGLPRGGVPVADAVARALDAPLDVWLVRKIGMPIQPELGMGALAEGAALVLDESTVRWSGTTTDELRAIVHQKAAEIRRRAQLYRGDSRPPDVRGKTVILVDDGIATGGTFRAAIRGARKRGAAWVVVAAPVAAAEAADALRREADEVVCLSLPHHLMSVSAWYQDFHQLPQSEVMDLLAEARRRRAIGVHPDGTMRAG